MTNTYTESELNEFQASYEETSLWSSTYGEDGENSLDDGEHDISAELQDKIDADCRVFLDSHADTIRDCEMSRSNGSSNFTMAGHDFWLNRCGHGAGFWDGDYSEPHATVLDEAATAFGNVDLYVGDDGLIYSY